MASCSGSIEPHAPDEFNVSRDPLRAGRFAASSPPFLLTAGGNASATG
jgi:hypothetical protein